MSRPNRAAWVRYAGLAGSCALAYAAYHGGASSPWHPTSTPATIFSGLDGLKVPAAWFAGTALLITCWCLGWRMPMTARWAYVTAGLWALPLLFFLPLGSYDAYSYACQGWQQAAGLDPYSGGVDVLGCPWREAVAPTWLSSPAPYGPVFLVLAGAAAKIGGSLTGTIAMLRVIAVLGVLLVAACLPALARRSGVPAGRAVWLALACPLVPIHLISGTHNDAAMAGFLVGGLTAAAFRRPLLAGALLGLAVGVKATAAVALPFAVILAVRSRGPAAVSADTGAASPDSAISQESAGTMPRMRLLARPEAWSVVAGAVAALGVVSLLSGRGFGWVTGLMGSGVSVQWTAPSTALGMTIDLVGPDAVPVTRIAGIVCLVAVLVILWWRAWNGDALGYAGYALAATVVLAPVFHPWYATWPLPILAATVGRPTRWLVVPPAVGAALCLPDGYNLALATKSQGAVLMTIFVIYATGKAVHEAKNRSGRRARTDSPHGHLPDRAP